MRAEIHRVISLCHSIKQRFQSLPLSFYAALLAVSIIYLVLISPYIISRFEVYAPGETADKDIVSPLSTRVEDIERQQLAAEVTQLRRKRYYTWDRQNAFEMVSFIEEVFSFSAEMDEKDDLTTSEKIQRIQTETQQQFNIEIPEDTAQYILSNATNHNLISSLRSLIIDLYFHNAVVSNSQEKHTAQNDIRNNLMIAKDADTEEEVRPPRSFATRNEALNRFRRMLTERGAGDLYPVFEAITSANMYYNAQLTRQKTQEILDDIGTIRYWVGRGEMIVRVGDQVSEQKHHILSELDKTIDRYRLPLNAGYFVFILFNLILQLVLLRFYIPDFKLTTKNLFLSSLATILVVIIGRFFILAYPSWGQYLIMAPLATLLNFTILGKKSALILAINGSLYYSLMSHLSLQIFVTTLFSSLIILLLSNRIKERKDLLLAGLASGTTFGLIVVLLGYLDTPETNRLGHGLLGIINGILSGSLTLVICPVFEQMFRMSTFMRLLEITNPQYELLTKLKNRAYGTFEHSLEVSQLIENLQDHFPIDILLLKAGALYHDIGKIKNPKFFTENQKEEDENPHDKLKPFESARIIKDHVKYSLEIAEKYKLPDSIVNFIREHHGTTRLEVFYQKALSQNSQSIINEKEFRYDGPKPQSLETGILHIADAVSATMKSLDEVNSEIITQKVTKIIDERLKDGQFDESPLTFRQLTILRREIINFYHQKYLKKRINYDREQKKISSGDHESSR